jgi:hypothetical protein
MARHGHDFMLITQQVGVLAMKSLYTLLVAILPFLMMFSATSNAAVVAQDRVFGVSSTDPASELNNLGDVTLKDAGNGNSTSGAFTAADLVLVGWTWTKDGNDYIIRDGAGNISFTMDEAANQANSTGACVDGPTKGDFGGSWNKK